MTTPFLLQQIDAWLPQARDALARAPLRGSAQELGRIVSAADGIAQISGLPSARLNELLRFENGDLGYVLSLSTDTLACVLLDDAARLSAGMQVSGTGEVLCVPVGEALLGRVVDPLGRPLDGLGLLKAERHDPVERDAPAITDRAAVVDPVQTGTLAIDALFSLGRGQRELIIGDRATGKTTIAVDAIISQRNTDMVCVYVAVGQRASTVAQVIQAVREFGNLARCIFVVAPAASTPGLQWIAPFAGFTVAEYFRDKGQHALVVVDDLSKHAATHRELALLTRQPPGREAYPGDVFYVHARLLERAARLKAELGGGTLTALPIAETEAGNLSAYIPTNLISITDGQIVLDTALFQSGHMPAIDTGLSVSRVGGKTQAPVLRQTVETLRLDYAQFMELESFTRFAAALDPRSQARLARGERTRQILAQVQCRPLSLTTQVMQLMALQHGLLDALPLAQVQAFKQALQDWMAGPGRATVEACMSSFPVPQHAQDACLKALHELLAELMRSQSASAKGQA